MRAAPAALGAARLMTADCIAAEETANPSENATAPNAIQTAKYPDAAKAIAIAGRFSPTEIATRWYSSSIGQLDGSIMAIIMACHVTRNIPAAPHGVWPGVDIHIIGITQPPGMGMPPVMLRALVHVITAAARNTLAAAAP